MIELVVLDIAGTTVEEHGAVYVALRETVEVAGGSAADVSRWMGADKREALAAMLGRSDVDDAFADFHRRLDSAYAAVSPVWLPGVPAALAKLRASGIKVALTIGFDRPVVDGLLAVLEPCALGAVVCVDDVPAGRPAPYMIFRAMELTGVRSVARLLTAGDTVRDLEAGTNAGAGMVVGVLTGGQSAIELGAVRHSHILPSVADLPALLLTEGHLRKPQVCEGGLQ